MSRRSFVGVLFAVAALAGSAPPAAVAAQPPAICRLLPFVCAPPPRNPGRTPEIDPGTLRGAVLVLAGVGVIVAERRRRS